MISLHQGFELHEGGQRIWLVLCLTVLVLALAGFTRVLWTQEGLSASPKRQDSPPQAAALLPGWDGNPQHCEELLGQNGDGWIVGQTAVPALFVARPGGADTSIWLGQQENLTGVSEPSYSSVWRDVTLPEGADSLFLAWSWWLQSSEEPAAAPSTGSDRQQALLLDEEGEILDVMHNARNHAARSMEQRYDLAPFAGKTVRVYFNAYNDGNSLPTSLRLDSWVLMSCQADPEPGDPVAPSNANNATPPSTISGWSPAAKGFSLWFLAIGAFVSLAVVGLVENTRSKPK